MMRTLFYISFYLLFSLAYPQATKNENLANEYYKQGDFLKAGTLFEEVYKKKKVKSVYVKYVDCLIKTQAYKAAEKTIKTFYKKVKIQLY